MNGGGRSSTTRAQPPGRRNSELSCCPRLQGRRSHRLTWRKCTRDSLKNHRGTGGLDEPGRHDKSSCRPAYRKQSRSHFQSPALSVFIERRNACPWSRYMRSEEHMSELQSLRHLVCRLLL